VFPSASSPNKKIDLNKSIALSQCRLESVTRQHRSNAYRRQQQQQQQQQQVFDVQTFVVQATSLVRSNTIESISSYIDGCRSKSTSDFYFVGFQSMIDGNVRDENVAPRERFDG
jgi:hypothetical protein